MYINITKVFISYSHVYIVYNHIPVIFGKDILDYLKEDYFQKYIEIKCLLWYIIR